VWSSIGQYFGGEKHLRQPNNTMWFQDLPSPRKNRLARNEESGEGGPTDGRGADATVLLATGSDLGIRPSVSVFIPPTPHGQEPNGIGTALSLMTRLTFPLIVSSRTGSLFRRRKRPHPVDHTVDPIALPSEGELSSWPTVLFPLKSVAGSLSAILEHCDVLSPLWHITHDAYSCSRKRWRVARR